jgi:hypothetical protein
LRSFFSSAALVRHALAQQQRLARRFKVKENRQEEAADLIWEDSRRKPWLSEKLLKQRPQELELWQRKRLWRGLESAERKPDDLFFVNRKVDLCIKCIKKKE